MPKQHQSNPIPRIVGLLSFSGLTLAGVAMNLPPEVILLRTAMGTGLSVLLAKAFVGLLRFQTS